MPKLAQCLRPRAAGGWKSAVPQQNFKMLKFALHVVSRQPENRWCHHQTVALRLQKSKDDRNCSIRCFRPGKRARKEGAGLAGVQPQQEEVVRVSSEAMEPADEECRCALRLISDVGKSNLFEVAMTRNEVIHASTSQSDNERRYLASEGGLHCLLFGS